MVLKTNQSVHKMEEQNKQVNILKTCAKKDS